MKIENSLFWIVIGIITALIYLISIEWSVRFIHPGNEKKSMRLIIGGTILRWILIIIVLIFSLSFSTLAAIIVFCTFMVLRLVFLIKWQGWLRASQ